MQNAEAATTASLLKPGARGGPELERTLLAALGDQDAMVRAGAARSVGVLAISAGFDAVAPLLGDASAEVRLHALGALRRLDSSRAKSLAAVPPLTGDADPRVARVAQTLLE
jgi:HEAT repeat protein